MIDRTKLTPRDRLCLALDVPDLDAARALLDQVRDEVGIIKIGYRLAYAGGLELARELASDGHKVFVDLKLLDIDNTVAEGVNSLKRLGAALLTVHAYPKCMRAALAVRGEDGPALLGVTVLTSMDDADLKQAGYAFDVASLVEARARDARAAGMQGIVCSAQEAGRLRTVVGPDMLLVTPGIRPPGSDAGDQKRVMTPRNAIADGADILVVGRPVLAAAQPADAARAIVDEIASAL